jgi:hypothetical protein
MTFKTISLNRRHFALTALGGFTTLSLAACGGGGGDGTETSTVNLRAAFDKIQYRMTKDEVRVIVGRHEDDESNFSWTEGSEDLRVFTSNDSATAVRWQSGSSTLRRELDLGE